MELVSLHERAEIEAFARRDPLLYLYELGDLDDFFWPHTVWFGLRDGGELRQLALLYLDMALPVLLAHARPPAAELGAFLRQLSPVLPRRFYCHVEPEVAAPLEDLYRVEAHGLHDKMGLREPSRLGSFDAGEAVQLGEADLPAVEALYAASYPGNWFVPRMLRTGRYFGVRRGGRLVSVAGVHVYSPRYGVAALGNVTTRPELRGRGLGTATCAALCRALIAEGIADIGLNVRSDNAAAIAAYRRLGFERVAVYGEYTLTLRG